MYESLSRLKSRPVYSSNVAVDVFGQKRYLCNGMVITKGNKQYLI